MSFWKKHAVEPVPMQLRFTPQLDITPYELAVICAKCTPNEPTLFKYGVWETLGPDIQRHFK